MTWWTIAASPAAALACGAPAGTPSACAFSHVLNLRVAQQLGECAQLLSVGLGWLSQHRGDGHQAGGVVRTNSTWRMWIHP